MSSDLVELCAADRHAAVAAGFADRVAAVVDWEVPAPVEGWLARDVVRHLVEWFPAFLAAGGIELPSVGSVDDDPVGAWAARTLDVQSLFALGDQEFTHPFAGTHRLADAIDRFYTADVFMHTWDLARATGQDERLDPGFCALLLAGMEPIDDLLRSSGQYGPRVEVAADADVQTRLIAFIGRRP